MATVTNQTASEAYPGQSVRVFLSQAETVSKLPNVTVGQTATISSSSVVGYVAEVDKYGTTFLVRPQYPFKAFQSDTTGYLKATETITLS